MITSNQALAILAAATTKAVELGVAANIVVLDAGAHQKAFHRMDGAVLGSIDVAIGKARTSTANIFRMAAGHGFPHRSHGVRCAWRPPSRL